MLPSLLGFIDARAKSIELINGLLRLRGAKFSPLLLLLVSHLVSGAQEESCYPSLDLAGRSNQFETLAHLLLQFGSLFGH